MSRYECHWCGSPVPSDYPCCVPAWFFQIGIHESARQALAQSQMEQLRWRLDAPKFFPPDNPEE